MENVGQLASHDPIWDAIRQAAAAVATEEPILGSLAYASVLNQSCFASPLSYIFAQRRESEAVPSMLLRQVFDALPVDDAEMGIAPRPYLVAVCERYPACNSPLEALLFFKGFHAIQAYRFAHALL